MDKLTINLQELKEYDLTPNQYFLLKCIKAHNLDYIFWDYSADYEILQTKGYIPFDKSKQVVNSDKFNFPNFINEWMSLWPTFELPGGYRVSGNTMEVKKRMKTFFKNHPEYTPEQILSATNNYLSSKKIQNWAYTKKNSKFIYDADGSMLEQECQALVSGNSAVRDNTVNL